MGELGVAEGRQVMQQVFHQYDTDQKGELNPVQIQILHADMRMGGVSFPQVLASMQYTCVGRYCQVSELFDLLQELDRRYFLLQDLRWEFSLLDRDHSDTISVDQARWLMQAVHGRCFSRPKWERFVKGRAVPGSGVGFAEIEVMLCDIPSRTEREVEQRRLQQEEEEKLRRKREFEDAVEREKEKMRLEKEELRKQKQREKDQEEEERRKRREEEEERMRKEEEERLRQLEEEERKRREEEEEKYRNVEKLRDEAEKAEKETDEKLKQVKQQKDGADGKRRAQLEDEEKTLNKHLKEHRHKRIRYQLKVAVKTRDKFQLEYSIKEFKKAELSDDDMDLQKAQKLLRQIGAKEGLHKAMTKREIEDLEKAMTFIKKHGFEAELAQEMMTAGKLLGRLRRLERIRHEILELKQSTVAEIRSYTKPPPIVHTVMTAVFLLLGHAEKETKDWKAVQALVGKTGKESLKRRCLELKPEKLPLPTVKRSNTLLSKFELDDVRDISAGAATFYVWATAMIEEVLDRQE
ncbi:uncharacterized protein LOC143294889 [Babylonia areolata]|uniref:uncharacterized protein LOC143294889 n=1 Tax=Babylonia areolata TaxID=304850 RepID=UPI003FD21F66